MIINHNISALNAHRQLGANQGATQNSLEKLSSGLRINKAGDDAAGLAISEKMRGQIKGLEMASKNAQDGISLIQTAEGALNETHAILQRMRELAVQSSNDTNNGEDRDALQDEMNQLSEEITRISDNTEFNTKNLLGEDGGAGFTGKFHIGANADQSIELSISNMSASSLSVGETYVAGENGEITGLEFKEGSEAVDYTVSSNITASTITYTPAAGEETTATFDADGAGGAGYYAGGDLVLAADEPLTENSTTTIDGEDDVDYTVENTTTSTITYTPEGGEETEATFNADGADGAGYYAGEELVLASDRAVEEDGTIASTEAGYYDGNKLVIAADKELAEGAKVTAGISISSQEDADSAITTINSAIETVSAERSKLGAVQNRLEHTINNLGTSAENLTAAESRIRDVDMAKEMMEFTKNNILQQAAQSMIAQANQQPQGVLQLLR